MILVKNKWFPFGNYKAINICGIVFYKGDNLSDKTINHEKIHTKQMIELLFIFFYLWYGIEYLIIRLFHKKQNDVYHDVSFEEEAHNNDDNLNYIDTRKHYAWFKYIKVKSSNNKNSKKKVFSLMEKTNCLLDAVKNQLQNAISNIDAGNSNLNEEEMEELVKTLSVLNKGVKRISKAYACEHILHCSPATFDNYVRAGIIPKGKKEIGFNELSWSLKDFDGVKLQRIHKK